MIGRPRTCECGSCAKCRKRERARAAYQAMSPAERRAWVARRDPAKTRISEARRFQRNKDKRMALAAAWVEKNREKRRQILSEWEGRNPEKIAAHTKVNNAIRGGRLTRQPCEICGALKVDAHHADYSKPLDVRWLCHAHHMELHRAVAA